MERVNLNHNQRETLRQLRALGGWRSTYNHHELNGRSLNALLQKGILEKRLRPGSTSITEFRIKTEYL